ncbi:CsbD family protein [Nocardioides zeae]|uniref:CsbD family protein n=1 Tax=Nocardioides zeae TaxID=1457234 RepID=A0A6P0HH21_9ACTN|nr:CsbD family protein [Nocardioides zeae]NEN77587.1 CsbD family protein [Nocardioides zeae]
MGIADKAKNAAEDLKGKAKEVVGDVTGNDELKAEGKADQTKSSAKQAGENVKDVFKG